MLETPVDEAIKTCEGMCRKIVRTEIDRRCLSVSETDDLMQVARLAVWEATKKFEGRGGAKFTTFAWMVVKSRVRNSLRTVRRHTPLPVNEEGETMDVPAPPHRYEDLADAAELRRKVALLNEQDRRIVELRLKGLTFEEMGKELGLVGKNLKAMAAQRMEKAVQALIGVM